MRHPRLLEFERTLQRLFDEIDDHLERVYGGLYELHPARPAHGRTASRAHDGLFNVGASFSAGYASALGRGYVVQVDLVTLERVPPDVRAAIEEEVAELARGMLPRYFPGRRLDVSLDGHTYKIHGDLSLGTA